VFLLIDLLCRRGGGHCGSYLLRGLPYLPSILFLPRPCLPFAGNIWGAWTNGVCCGRWVACVAGVTAITPVVAKRLCSRDLGLALALAGYTGVQRVYTGDRCLLVPPPSLCYLPYNLLHSSCAAFAWKRWDRRDDVSCRRLEDYFTIIYLGVLFFLRAWQYGLAGRLLDYRACTAGPTADRGYAGTVFSYLRTTLSRRCCCPSAAHLLFLSFGAAQSSATGREWCKRQCNGDGVRLRKRLVRAVPDQRRPSFHSDL